MKCPYCGEEMEQGFLQGRNRIAWVKKKHLISTLPKEGEVLLENNTFKDFTLTAFICKSCKKIIVDYSDKDIEKNISVRKTLD